MKAIPWEALQRDSPCLVTMGNFDGVHLGHQEILSRLAAESREAGLPAVLVTFEPHPRYYFKPAEKPSLLTTPEEKAELLSAWPVEPVFLAFDLGLARMEAKAFVADVLLGRLRARRFLLGHDHRFGQGARGDIALIRELAGVDNVREAPAHHSGGELVSSSLIRRHLEEARPEIAESLLGRPFYYTGTVVEGDGRGRLLGFPTANIAWDYPHKVWVAPGVYGATLEVGGREYPAVANIGKTPTFGGEKTKVEAHVLDFQGDIYGQSVRLRLFFHLRGEKKFPSVSELTDQIASDIAEFRRLWRRREARPT